MSTFGLIVPGRAVDTSFQQVESNKFLITIPNADSLNHVVVFLTGLNQVPPGAASCIFFSLPDPNAPPTWHYLGYLTNEKPSAIYKLTNLTQTHLRIASENRSSMTNPVNGGAGDLVAFNYTQAPVIHLAQIGISIEPLESVIQMTPATHISASKVTNFAEFINKTVGNLYNYCSSFSRPASELIGNPFQSGGSQNSVQFVPLSAIQTWYENYTRRLSNDQNFWKSLN